MNYSEEEYGKRKIRELSIIFSIGTIGSGILLYLRTGIPVFKIIAVCSGLFLLWITLFKLIWYITKNKK